MTCDQLRIDAQTLTGSKIEPTTSFLWSKDAITYIARHYPMSSPSKKVDVVIENDNGSYTIPDELVRLDKITLKGENRPLTSMDYNCNETGLIYFFTKGTYSIYYRYVPALPSSATEQIGIPERYSEPIKYYLAAKIRARVFGQADTDAQTYEALFSSYLDSADASMSQTNKRHRRMPARY